jgi:hypothetical protein
LAQPLFKDPIVSAGPTLTGVGDGTLAVDKLTHFTTAQTYTLTCIAKSPDTLFSVVGSLDGPVGIATVGSQFFDDDLKIFLTIQQGPTPFEVGDIFTVTVVNGTDLHQDNIDDYDEQPQKNFGLGVKGTLSGDHNLRFSEDDIAASLLLAGLKYVAVTPGEAGNDLQIQYLDYLPAVAADLTLQDLTFDAVTPGAAGNNISIEYLLNDPAVKASLVFQDLTYQAQNAGVAGNSITIEYTAGGVAGSEIVSVLGNAITVQIQSGLSNANQIRAAVLAFPAAVALVDVSVSGVGTSVQTAPDGPDNLVGGSDAVGLAGFEVVSVLGNAISVKFQSGVSTATQIKAALDASGPATALITTTISGTGSNAQTGPVAATNLANGADAIGLTAAECVVTGDLIKVHFVSGTVTAQDVKDAVDAVASALVTVELFAPADERQFNPLGPTNLTGGKSKYYSFNKNELTEPGIFNEGNASVRMHDAEIQGRASIAQDAEISGKVTLKDSGSNVVPDLQAYLNGLIQDQKISLRTADHTKVQWSKPDLSFEADIVIDFNDTGVSNTIAVAESPITIPDGDSLYVILDRDNNVAVAAQVGTMPEMLNAFRIATRHGDHLILWDNTLVRDGKAVRIGEGGEGGTVRVDLYDPVTTVLPTTAPQTIDGVTLATNMTVLFTNLATGNKRIYKAFISGPTITWVAQSSYSTGLDPVLGDDVLIIRGTSFAFAHGIYDSSEFKFNDIVRFYNGVDYWELSSLKTQTLAAGTTDDVFTVEVAGSENMVIDYSILRGSVKETGTIHVTSDGLAATATTNGTYIGVSGVTFSADVSAGDLRLRYTTTAGAAATMKYFVRRWSDAAGGPGGIPSYSSVVSGISAAGANSQIQFNDSGNLGADSDFTWDKTSNILGLAGLEVHGLSAPVTLLDNIATPTTFLQYNAANYPFVIIEFSMKRDAVYQLGRLLIVNDGTNVVITSDFATTGGIGITISAQILSGNVHLQYESTATTFSTQLKYGVRRWS